MTNVWAEYDDAAEYLAKRGRTGKIGEPLPEMLSAKCLELINEDPEAFESRVRLMAYALARRARRDDWIDGAFD